MRGRVCHINERALYFLIGVALAAVRILHATERRIWTGAYDPKTKEETAHAMRIQKATISARTIAASVCLQTSLSRRAPPAMCSLVYEDESEGKEQPAHQRRVHFPTVLHWVHDADGWRLISSPLVCFSTSRHLETPLRCDRLDVAKPFRSVGWEKDRSDHTTAESLTLQASA